MRIPRPLALVVLAALAVQARAETVVVGPEQRTAIGLTLYAPENLALVRDVRHVSLPAGELVLRYTGVPERLDPRTVSLHGDEPGPALRVHDQTFRYDLASADRLLARWLGKSVELVETDQQLATKVTAAELLALGSPPIYRVGDRLLLGHPGRVQLPPLGVDLFLTPTLSWTITSAGAGERELDAAYAADGLGWEADYTLALADASSPTTARLDGWATIRNDTDAAFEHASVALVAGHVHRVASPVIERPLRMRAQSLVAASGLPQAEPLMDYHRYALPDPIHLGAREVKQVPLLAADDVHVERTYRVTGPGLRMGGPTGEDEQKLPAEVRLRSVNDRGHGLGKPLPPGIVRVQAPASGGTVEFVGEDRIGPIAEGEPIDLRIGDASDLVVKWRETDYRQTGSKPYEAEVAVEIAMRNRGKADAPVEIREPLSGSWKVLESTLEATRVNAATLGFTTTIPAEGSLKLSYRVQLGP